MRPLYRNVNLRSDTAPRLTADTTCRTVLRIDRDNVDTVKIVTSPLRNHRRVGAMRGQDRLDQGFYLFVLPGHQDQAPERG